MATIKEILKSKNTDEYTKLKNACKESHKKSHQIQLGDSIENLMKANSYKRVSGAIRQIK